MAIVVVAKMTVREIDARTAKTWLDAGEAVLIDVREPAEHAAQHIPGARLQPLGSVCCDDLPATEGKILIHCQKGARGSNACQKLMAEKDGLEIYNIQGGIEAWQQAGLPVQSSGRKTLPLDRQVQITIGLSVLIFSLLGYFLHPVYSFGAAFFGAGLLNAGLTGWCGLAKLMARMPWNQV